MIIIIGPKAQALCDFLKHSGLDASPFLAEQLPSLMTLILEQEAVTDIVIMERQHKHWSTPHILAVAKRLQGRGRMILLGCQEPPAAPVAAPADKFALLDLLLEKPSDPAANTSGSSGSGGLAKKPISPPVKQLAPVRPLSIPQGKILFLGVIGSQHRIGCTTQAIGLWHYCKALGFDPAVVSSPEQITEIASPMHCEEIPGGYRIEGIPFVADTANAYDCYILDIGPGSIQEAQQATDCLVLVAGSKPWELQHTAAALRAARGKDILVLLSFSSQTDANSLQPLFGQLVPAITPWMPDIWTPSLIALATYDMLLRPALKKFLSRADQEYDLSDLQKGE